jgi:hypothetical protein
MYYAFVRVRPPLDETFVVTSGDVCKEVAVFNGKTWSQCHEAFLTVDAAAAKYVRLFVQGILTEGEGSILLTSLD